MAEFSEIIIGALIFGLIILGLISFAVSFANENSINQTILGYRNTSSLYSKINSTLSSVNNNATAQKNALIEEGSQPTTVLSTFGFVFRSIINAANIFLNVGVGMISYVFVSVQDTLGIPPVVSGVIMAILIIALIFAMHRAWKGFGT